MGISHRALLLSHGAVCGEGDHSGEEVTYVHHGRGAAGLVLDELFADGKAIAIWCYYCSHVERMRTAGVGGGCLFSRLLMPMSFSMRNIMWGAPMWDLSVRIFHELGRWGFLYFFLFCFPLSPLRVIADCHRSSSLGNQTKFRS